jgi:hypothetical protein
VTDAQRFRWPLQRGVALSLQFSANLADMKRACRSILSRLPDAWESGCELVTFNAEDTGSLEIAASGTTEELSANVASGGRAVVPCAIFWNMATGLRTYRKRILRFVFSQGEMKVERMQFRDPRIALGP